MATETKTMTEQELVNLVDREFDNSQGVPGGDIAAERAKAWDYFLSKLLGNEEEGQSKVVTADVAEVVDSIMPSMLRIFTTADNVVSFEPEGEEDEEAAEQESDYITHVFFKRNPAFMTLFFWFFDAMVQKNGIVKAWWDESEARSQERYRGLTDTELALLTDDEELEIEEHEERTERVTQDVQTVIGVLPVEVEETVHDVIFRRVTKKGRTRVAPVPPEHYRISRNARSLDPCDSRFVGEERPITRSELLEMGFDKALVEGLPTAPAETEQNPESDARRDKSDERDEPQPDWSQEEVLVREAYIRVDFDGDGYSELRQVFVARGSSGGSNTNGKSHITSRFMSQEEVDRQPYHVISPHPLPHKHFGRATAEKVMDIQEVRTTLTRQILDNLYHTNNPGHAVWEMGMGDNTLDDLLTTRVGRVARFRRPPSESYMPMTTPFTAAASFPMLEHFDKEKRDRTGVSSDGQGLTPDALKNIQISVLANQMDQSKMKIEAIARIFAETGVKSLFLHIHELELKHQNKERRVKLRNKWVSVDPREWRQRYDMTVNIGLGIGTREQNLLHLESIWQKQIDAMKHGGQNLLVKPRNLFNTAAAIVKNATMQPPDSFFSDPGDALAPPPTDEQKQFEQLQAQLQKRQQDLDMRSQQLDMADLQHKHDKAMLELAQKHEESQNKLVLGMEALKNQLTEMELKYGRDVPGSGV
ncbi:portal protein [Methyloceanibacter caenitepidi]|uniref:Phage portal protein n=1 Tax=Methyloceanibacter caenitepidi TaxID=1384459 RepID=A0A0A8K2E4_9HYPH|nr:hypothetical protein [Methyloceanibacter caenitepidi]BAQ16921.1 phage portal protein [Methyloceanibacter caenitepidi]